MSYKNYLRHFFSNKMKEYIIDACKENDFDLQSDDLNKFIGTMMISPFNKRKSQRDYWLSDSFCSCEIGPPARTHDKFE